MAEWIDPYVRIARLEEALERAEAALREIAALADERAEHGQVADASGDPEWTLLVRAASLRAVLARAEKAGVDR